MAVKARGFEKRVDELELREETLSKGLRRSQPSDDARDDDEADELREE